jgi:hypothetical protein
MLGFTGYFPSIFQWLVRRRWSGPTRIAAALAAWYDGISFLLSDRPK